MRVGEVGVGKTEVKREESGRVGGESGRVGEESGRVGRQGCEAKNKDIESENSGFAGHLRNWRICWKFAKMGSFAGHLCAGCFEGIFLDGLTSCPHRLAANLLYILIETAKPLTPKLKC